MSDWYTSFSISHRIVYQVDNVDSGYNYAIYGYSANVIPNYSPTSSQTLKENLSFFSVLFWYTIDDVHVLILLPVLLHLITSLLRKFFDARLYFFFTFFFLTSCFSFFKMKITLLNLTVKRPLLTFIFACR